MRSGGDATRKTARCVFTPAPVRSPEVERDLNRLAVHYANHGSRTRRHCRRCEAERYEGRVAITITISEGSPTIVESIAFEGFDPIPSHHLNNLKREVPFALASRETRSRYWPCRTAVTS